MRSIESEFKFLSYKVDSFSFEMEKNLEYLRFNGSLDPMAWHIDVKVHIPTYYKKFSIYLVNIECHCFVRVKNEVAQTEVDAVKLQLSISGVFSSNGQLPSDVESRLVKFQAPAILMSYARASITSFISNAGFGTFVFPLVNMNTIAQNSLGENPIQIIE